jgi:hypothetical protein
MKKVLFIVLCFISLNSLGQTNDNFNVSKLSKNISDKLNSSISALGVVRKDNNTYKLCLLSFYEPTTKRLITLEYEEIYEYLLCMNVDVPSNEELKEFFHTNKFGL